MAQISLRPELVTSSGEACGIMLDGQYVGSLTLLYREADRIWGSVQLDEEVLDADEKEEVDVFIHRYIENMIDAAGAIECFVSTTYSPYDHIISTDQIGQVEEMVEVESGVLPQGYEDYEQLEDGLESVDEYNIGQSELEGYTAYDEPNDYITFDEAEDPLNAGELEEIEYGFEEEDPFELRVVGESRNRVEYQLLDREHDMVAEAILFIDRTDVFGDVFWHVEPSDEQIDEVTHILVTDYDQDCVDSFEFNMFYEDEEIAKIELTHEDLLTEEEYFKDEYLVDEDDLYVDVYESAEVDLHFELIRDDIDTMTFDIYEEEGVRASRLATATVDLSAEPSAFIEFINPRDQQLRDQLAYRLINEIDKEMEYETFSITMKYQGETIDEYAFDTEEQPQLVYC